MTAVHAQTSLLPLLGGDGDGDENVYGVGEEANMDVDDAALMEALAMNERLKRILAEQEAETMQHDASTRRLGMKPTNLTALPAHVEANRGKGGWGGQTYSKEQRQAINKGNLHLVNRLTAVAVRNGTPATAAPHPGPKKSTQAINRQKEQDKIARENQRMVQRLTNARTGVSVQGPAAPKARNSMPKHTRVPGSSRPAWQD
jgi:hypothetical protein